MTSHLIAGLTASALLLGATLVHPAFAWLVGAPLVVAARRGVRASVALGVTFATSFAVAAHARWLTEAGERYFALSLPAAVAGALSLAVGCGVGFGALLGLLLHAVRARDGRWTPLALGAGWVTWEELTRIGFPSYPWVALAATQADTAVVLQTASLAGQAGLAFVLAAAGGCVGQALARLARRRPPWRPLLLAGLLVTAVVGGGALRLRAAEPAGERRCTVAAVDARVPAGPLPTAATLDRYRAASDAAFALDPDVVVWPESALPRDPRLDPDLMRELRTLARERGVVLIAGGPRVAWDADWQQLLHNSLFATAPDGTVHAYDKRALVPIAEYWPLARLRAPDALRVAEVEPGAGPALIRVAGCTIGTLVCSDAERPALARELAVAGADAIVVASNDAPLPPRAVATEVAQARLRAVESGLPLLRAANAGASVALDRYGRTVAEHEGVVALEVAAPPLRAPATRLAVPFLALCALATAVSVTTGLGLRTRP